MDARSERNLKGVHPDLEKVVRHAYTMAQGFGLNFIVIEGRRTLERQKELLKAKATTTLNSRHLTGHAVDIVPTFKGKIRWDWPLYHELAVVIKAAAMELGVKLNWGGDWKTFKDGPHWELDWKTYP